MYQCDKIKVPTIELHKISEVYHDLVAAQALLPSRII